MTEPALQAVWLRESLPPPTSTVYALSVIYIGLRTRYILFSSVQSIDSSGKFSIRISSQVDLAYALSWARQTSIELLVLFGIVLGHGHMYGHLSSLSLYGSYYGTFKTNLSNLSIFPYQHLSLSSTVTYT
jgi:hypothetical protein